MWNLLITLLNTNSLTNTHYRVPETYKNRNFFRFFFAQFSKKQHKFVLTFYTQSRLTDKNSLN